MRLNRLVLVAIGVASAMTAASTASVMHAPEPAVVAATVGVFYATAYGLATVTATFLAHRAARRS